MKFRLWLAPLLIVAGTPAIANESLSLTVSPRRAFAPASVNVRVRIAPDADNRAIAISASSAQYFRSSEMPLEGDRAPRTIELQFRDIPDGNYEVFATLLKGGGRRQVAVHQQMEVLSRD
jgi:hypothetical protein